MRPLLHAGLVNEPFGDPGVFIEVMFEKRALLLDLGDIRRLSPRQVMRVTDVFVSHCHMDHFSGFDDLLRLCLGRDMTVRMFGPRGFLDRVEHKLAGYTWNLVGDAATDFLIRAIEFDPPRLRTATFRSRSAFGRDDETESTIKGGCLLDDPLLRVTATVLDHGTPCLGFAIEEGRHVNVHRNRLETLGLAVGPWLRNLKHAVLRGDPADTPVPVAWRQSAMRGDATLPLGHLADRILSVVSGQKIAYVTDVAFHEDNAVRIAALADRADMLFIETPFLDADAATAAARHHLTAAQAGHLARRAGVRRMIPFHFSPRYAERSEELRHEAEAAFSGDPSTSH